MRSFLLTLALALLLLGSCRTQEEELCSKRLPRILETLRSGSLALQPWVGEAAGRSPASTAQEMMKPDREGWQEWAAQRLTEIQDLIDLMEAGSAQRNFRNRLNTAANSVVQLHAYAEIGDASRMARVLSELDRQTTETLALLCSR